MGKGHSWLIGEPSAFILPAGEEPLWAGQLDGHLAGLGLSRADLAFDDEETRAAFIAEVGPVDR